MFNTKSALGIAGGCAVLVASITVCAAGPVRAAMDSLMTCGSLSPCLEWDNSKSGDAVKGVSTNGSGLEGQTKFNSTGKSAGKAGVLGADNSKAGTLNAGVSGTSTNGTGVTGQSTFANGVTGFTASAASGVYGQSASSGGFGVAGRNTATIHGANGAGVLADGNTASDGLHAFAYGTSANAVYAYAQSGSAIVANQGGNNSAPELALEDTNSSNHNHVIVVDGPSGDVFDVSPSGNVNASGTVTAQAITSQSQLRSSSLQTGSATMSGALQINSAGTFMAGAGGDGSPVLDLRGGTNGAGNSIFQIENSSPHTMLFVTDTGDLHVAGQLFTGGTCNKGCIVGGNQVRSVGEYAAVEAEPTIEDNGEAVMTDGVANVSLDPKFANVIDLTKAYLVSVTPEGECEGLYVAQRTPTGFVVRELRHAHDNVSFEYRIIAHRFGENDARLPMLAQPTAVRHAPQIGKVYTHA